MSGIGSLRLPEANSSVSLPPRDCYLKRLPLPGEVGCERMRSGMTNRAIADGLVVGGGLIVADIAPRGAANR